MTLAEGVQLVTFIILTAGVVLAALGVVLSSNIVYSAFLLGGVFISIAGLYLLLNASFVAFAQVLIYVGAVNVLILFAIMLVNKREDFRPLKFNWLRKGLTVLVCGGLFALLSLTVISTPWAVTPTPGASGDEVETLLGDPSKAKRQLGWEPRISFEQLVSEMMREDLHLAERDALIKQAGYKAFDYFE